jgi:hypothetical protein
MKAMKAMKAKTMSVWLRSGYLNVRVARGYRTGARR